MNRLSSLTLPIPLLGLISACSGGGVSVDVRGPTLPALPDAEPVTTIGVVSTDHALVVNGVHYDTANASVVINGGDASPVTLRRGHKAFVVGTIGPIGVSGTAESVVSDSDLVGRIETIAVGTRRIVLLGQRVVLDERTATGPGIDAPTLDGLSVGDRVGISGLRRADGALVATRIEHDTRLSGDQIVGRISAVNVAAMTFDVAGLVVNYRGASLIEIPGGSPRVGMPVVAAGELIDSVLVATVLRSASTPLPGRARERVLAYGLVTDAAQLSVFFLGDIAVRTDEATRYVNGDRSDLAADVRLIVDGRITADGESILAEAIRFDQ